MIIFFKELLVSNNEDENKKPSWLDIANFIVNLGLLVVAVLALIFK